MRLQFPWMSTRNKTRKRTRRRTSKAVKQARRENEELKDENTKLQKELWKLKKRLSKEKPTARPDTVPLTPPAVIPAAVSDITVTPTTAAGDDTSTPGAPDGPTVETPSLGDDVGVSVADDAGEIVFTPGTGGGPVIITPLASAMSLLQQEGVSPSTAPKTTETVQKYVTLITEMNKDQHAKSTLLRKLSGEFVREAKLAKALSEDLKVDRRVFQRKTATVKRNKAAVKRAKVTEFLMREDNATCLPGKRDWKKVGKERVQKYKLLDYIHTLYRKYKREFPDRTISLTSFRRGRTPNITYLRYNNRRMCLCTQHQNFKLMMVAANVKGTPDAYVSDVTPEKVNASLTDIPETVRVEQWLRQSVPYKETTIKKMKLVPTDLDRALFSDKFRTMVPMIQAHITRVDAQLSAVHTLKAKLPDGHASCQMDFAENWTIQYNREIQAAYFSKDQVTLHPVVVHWRQDERLFHQSFIFVSNDTSHGASSVFAFLKRLIPEVRNFMDLKTMHYLTDSPTSQYRNSTISAVLTKHEELLGMPASWTYFEVGHGKGPCDGIGGASKRAADDAVRRGRSIQSAREYFEWAQEESTTIRYVYVDREEIAASQEQLTAITASSRKYTGIMSAHALVGVGDGRFKMRATSCFGECCFDSEGKFKLTCPGWTAVQQFTPTFLNRVEEEDEEEPASSSSPTVPPPQAPSSSSPTVLPQPPSSSSPAPQPPSPPSEATMSQDPVQVGQYIAAVFEGTWYVAKIMETGDKPKVSFMWAARGGGFNWPPEEEKDECNIDRSQILLYIDPPVVAKNSFKLPKKTKAAIITAFKNHE